MVAGGDYYDRDVISTDSPHGYSTVSDAVFSRAAPSAPAPSTSRTVSTSSSSSISVKPVTKKKISAHKSMLPSRWAEEKLECLHKNPIVTCIDVTGSMGNWTKIIYDKLPMFYGQIMVQKYLEDPSLGFCGIGDAQYDKASLQISEFGQGRQIDQIISKMYLEGGGGGNGRESYELGGHFYLHHFVMDDSTPTTFPFLFFTGDEGFYGEVEKKYLQKVGLPDEKGGTPSKAMFQKLKEKFKGNVFLLKKRYYDGRKDRYILKNWKEALGEQNVIVFKTAKAVIDIMLGIIALKNGRRTLDLYMDDLKERGQTEERQKEVRRSLRKLAETCKFRGDEKIDLDGMEEGGEDEDEDE